MEIREDLSAIEGHVPNLYDAAKKLPSVLSLICCPAVLSLYGDLTDDWNPLVQSYAVRIDRPNDPSRRAPWHSESAYQPGMGLGFWTPLQPMTEELGPLEIAAGSHKDAPFSLSELQPESSAEPYARLIKDEAATIARYEVVKPLLDVGDLLVLNWDVLHRSGENVSAGPRLSVVWRLVQS